MKKYLALIFLAAAAVAGFWAYTVKGADGSVFVTVSALVVFLLWIGVTKYRTGKWFSESSGGR